MKNLRNYQATKNPFRIPIEELTRRQELGATMAMDFAFYYARKGWKIFPVRSKSEGNRPAKSSYIKNWVNEATNNLSQIEAWAECFPGCNFAVATGKRSRLVGLDIDIKKGAKGKESFKLLQDKYGKIDGSTVKTPSCGSHIYFQYPDSVDDVKNISKIDGYPGIELKGDGSCLILPGSVNGEGKEYKVIGKNDPAPCPEWILELKKYRESRGPNDRSEKLPKGWWKTLIKNVDEGNRNDAMTQLCGYWFEKGLSEEKVEKKAIETSNGWDKPLPEEEVISVVRSVAEINEKKHLEGRVTLELFKYENLCSLLEKVDLAKETGRIGRFHSLLYNSPELGYQIAAAFIYHDLVGSDDRLARVKNTLYQWTEHGNRWCPLLDVTRPEVTFNDVDYADGNQQVVDIFGDDFCVPGKKDDEIFSHHFNKAKTIDTRTFFLSYVLKHTPRKEELLLRRPGKTVSTADGLLIFEDGKYRLEDHRPDHGQILPSFPYRYRPWKTIPGDEKNIVIRYLSNLARTVPAEQRSKMVELLGFLIGYTLTPYREKFFPILIGPNNSGKTLFLELLQAPHGSSGTAVEVDFQQMQEKPTQFDSAAFIDTLVAIHDDFPPGGRLPAAMLKRLANPARLMTVNQKFKALLTIMNTASPYISTNEDPQADDTFLSDRLLCVPFDAAFSRSEQVDPANIDLVHKMHSPEIQQALFDFGIHCLKRFFRDDGIEGYKMPVVRACTDRVTGSLNDALAWLNENVEAGILQETPDGRVGRARLYKMYEAERKRPVGRLKFFTTMRRKYGREIKIHGIEHFQGLDIVRRKSLRSRLQK